MQSLPLRAAWAVAAAWLAAVASAQAQQPDAYPSRPLTMVVPMAAGGTADLLARAIGPALSTLLGQGVVVDNRVGANGAIGEDFVARSRPDGYTVMLESTSIATNMWMGPLPYDPRRAFVPVVQLASVPLVLVVNAEKVPSKTLGDFVALAHQQPGKLNYASWGNGSIGQFAGEVFKISAKADVTHVAYKSTAQALNDTLAGQVEAMFPTLPLAMQHLKTGKIRALALTSAKRSAMAPDIPTMAEAGLPGVEVETWFGVFFPAGTPAPIVQRMQAELNKVLAQPEVRARLDEQGFRIVGGTPAEFSKFYLSEIDRYERVVKQANMKSDS